VFVMHSFDPYHSSVYHRIFFSQGSFIGVNFSSRFDLAFLPVVIMPRTPARRSADLARRIESSGSVSHAACLACRRAAHQCIRSVVSVRCARCVRRNQRCFAFVSEDGLNPYVSSVRADIRRLRTSLTALERFVSFATAVPRADAPDDVVASPSNSATSDSSDSLADANTSDVANTGDGFSDANSLAGADDYSDADSFAGAGSDHPDASSFTGADNDHSDSPCGEVDNASAVEVPFSADTTRPFSSSSALTIPCLLNPCSPFRKFSFCYQVPSLSSSLLIIRIGSPPTESLTVPDDFAITSTSSDAPFDFIDPSVFAASAPSFSTDWYLEPPSGFPDFSLFFNID
jgi:hypothetical protein